MKGIIKKILNKIRGDISTNTLIKQGLKLGKNFKRMDGCRIDPSHCWLIEIGDNVTLAPHVIILAHDASTKFALGYTKIAKVRIGSNVFIGAGTIVLPGCTIGDNVIIGAGSVVSQDIPSNSVAVGNPCRVTKSYCEYMEYYKELLKKCPKYGVEFTLMGGITKELKEKMIKEIEKKWGFII